MPTYMAAILAFMAAILALMEAGQAFMEAALTFKAVVVGGGLGGGWGQAVRAGHAEGGSDGASVNVRCCQLRGVLHASWA
eukprot:1824066-Rhodomonas_salina.1